MAGKTGRVATGDGGKIEDGGLRIEDGGSRIENRGSIIDVLSILDPPSSILNLLPSPRLHLALKVIQ
jgi:hypothetical protein